MITFESIVNRLYEKDGELEFHSSASAEKYILENPPLRRASAFSWWVGSENTWKVAINRGGPFQFVTRVGGRFFVNGLALS